MEDHKVNYNAFKEDEDTGKMVSPLKSKGKSKFAPTGYSENKNKFEKSVSEYKMKDVEVKNKVAELSLKLKSFINDKTLSQNKSPLKLQIEKEAVSELIELGLDLNNDQNQPEGIGSIGIINLLMQLLLSQRDRLNEVSYENHKLKVQLEKIDKSLTREKEDE